MAVNAKARVSQQAIDVLKDVLATVRAEQMMDHNPASMQTRLEGVIVPLDRVIFYLEGRGDTTVLLP